MSAETLSFAGEVVIDEVTIINTHGFAQTITPQVIGIELYEDIFSPCMSGNLVIRDSQDLSGLFPLVGEEFLKIRFHTPSMPKEHWYQGDFFIYKMTDRFASNERELIYVLHFTSREAITDLNKKISRTYSGNVGQIAEKIIKSADGLESRKRVNIESTTSSTKYISNYWSPIRNIQYLTGNAVNQNGSPSYVFFENKYGLNFISLESLYTAPAKQALRWDNYSDEKLPGGGSIKNIEEDYKRILEIRTPMSFDYMDRIKSGMYANRMFHYDLSMKKYSAFDYFAPYSFKREKHLNSNSVMSSAHIARAASRHVQEHKYHANFSGYGDVTNTKTTQQRISLLTQAEANKLEILVFGRTDYSAGQVMDITIYKAAQLQEKERSDQHIDKLLSGRYLIAAINHSINREGHQCVIELIKESLLVNIDEGK